MSEEKIITGNVPRPDSAKIIGMFREYEMISDPRDRALQGRRIYDLICDHYEQYITSMAAKIRVMQANSEMLLANDALIINLVQEVLDNIKPMSYSMTGDAGVGGAIGHKVP